jgi:uncharacterized protein
MRQFKSKGSIDMRSAQFLTSLLISSALPMSALAQNTATPTILEEMIVARDGVALETFIYLPKGDGPFPTLVMRTIYGLPISPIGGHGFTTLQPGPAEPEGDEGEDDDASRAENIQKGWPAITNSGYALVIQNTRGRFGSEGLDRSWRDDGTDGYDLIEWIDAQSWSNGKIGLFGDSATGISALMAAAEQPPALDAVFVQNAPADPFGTDLFPIDGAPKIETLLVQGASITFDTSDSHREFMGLTDETTGPILGAAGQYLGALFEGLEDPTASNVWMALPLAEDSPFGQLMPFWATLTDAETLANYRDDVNVLGQVTVPTSVVTMWQDVFNESAMDFFLDLQARDVPRELLVLNGTHYDIDDPLNWPAPRMIPWFDRWLKGAEGDATPIVRYAVQETDDYRTTDIWPPADVETATLHLAPDGVLANGATTGNQSFQYDPSRPATTLGGRNLLAAAGSTNHAAFLERSDVISFSSAPYTDGLTLAGPITGSFRVATDVPSTDISVRILDHAPNGRAMLISQDLVRVQAEPGRTFEVPFDMGNIAHRLEAGHKITIAVNGSDFPAADRNLNTGTSGFESERTQVANTVISFGETEGSFVTITVAQ